MLDFVKFKIFEGVDSFKYVCSTKLGGVSAGAFESLNLGFGTADSITNINENYQILAAETNFNLKKLAWAKQVHGDHFHNLSSALQINELAEGQNHALGDMAPEPSSIGLSASSADGFITDMRGLPISVRFADCQGLLLFDSKRHVLAVAHCGWKGNAINVPGKIVRQMIEKFSCKAENILVGVSPSLGPCCSLFSNPRQEFFGVANNFINETSTEKAGFVDLWALTKSQLRESGISETNIEINGTCTKCNTDKFFSYRAASGQETGRMALLAWLT